MFEKIGDNIHVAQEVRTHVKLSSQYYIMDPTWFSNYQKEITRS